MQKFLLIRCFSLNQFQELPWQFSEEESVLSLSENTSYIPIRELWPQMLFHVAPFSLSPHPTPSPCPAPTLLNSTWLRNVVTVCTTGNNQRRNQSVCDKSKTAGRSKSKACQCQCEWKVKANSLEDHDLHGLSHEEPGRYSCQSPSSSVE